MLGDLGHDATAGYVLTFESPRAGDGRVHALKLETTRPDVRLRYRRSWRDAPLDEELATRVRGALLFGVDRPGLGATLTLLRRESKPQGDRAVVRITLSEAAVTLLPSAGGARLGELRVEAAVEPAHGSITPVRGRRVDLRLPAAVPDGPPIVSDLELPLGAAGGSVAIGVRDELSGDWAVLRLDVGGH